jgi:decaprenylphospho-beta-D-ribofuranose 2-oxidase
MVREICGWGRYPRIRADVSHFDNLETLRNCLNDGRDIIPYGLGRSYGDSALSYKVIGTRRFNAILAFDSKTGMLTCESGVTLAELIEVFMPRGWFLPVVPGTKFITIGGAIASDVHGKNHHQKGCFSQHVFDLQLMLADGLVMRCSPRENQELFRATCGGMGLTGVILTATFQLQAVPSGQVRQIIVPTRNIEDAVEAFEARGSWDYSVAWIDCLAGGENLGRSLLMLGEHAHDGRLRLPPGRQLTLPCNLPGFLLNKHTVSLFNHVYYRVNSSRTLETLVPIERFFFPLDAVRQWNLLYGGRGFTQYQLVLPKEASLSGLKEILKRIAGSGMGSFLAVLKLLGPENVNHLSFPLHGYTLALDFKIEKRLFALLDELDRIVLEHGGRLYLTKDARMNVNMFRYGYPRWEQFHKLRKELGLDNKFASLQSKRLEI